MICFFRYYYGRKVADVYVPEPDEHTNDSQLLFQLMADSMVFSSVFDFKSTII